MKSFKMNLKVSEYKHPEWKTVETNAEINISDRTSFAELVEFGDNIKKTWRKAMRAIKAGSSVELEITESTYDNWCDPDKPLVQTSFNRWFCTEEGQNDEGIYLRPDERYTESFRDMYLTKDVLNDLAFTLR